MNPITGEAAQSSTPVDIVPGFVVRDAPPPAPSAVGALSQGDLDGDGRIDLVAPVEGGFQVWLALGDLAFSSASFGPYAPTTIAVGDVTGDGLADLLLATPSGIDVLQNISTGPGSVDFAALQVLTPSDAFFALALLDRDLDGDLDLAAAGGSTNWLYDNEVVASPIPEPATMLILGAGVLALLRRRTPIRSARPGR